MTQPPETDRPLIPQFSLRLVLLVVTASAVVFSLFALGLQGSAWAAAVSVAILSLVVMLSVYASAFGVVWIFSVITSVSRRKKTVSGTSPFRAVNVTSKPTSATGPGQTVSGSSPLKEVP